MSTNICKNCHAELSVAPGTKELSCSYCGFTEALEQSKTFNEFDYHLFLQFGESDENSEEMIFHSCSSCSAQISTDPEINSDICPYCGTGYIAKEPEQGRTLLPGSILPFKLTEEETLASYQKWAKKQWLAPNEFKNLAQENRIERIYIPHWAYHTDIVADYRGSRGEDYRTTESYTTTENGKTVTKSRKVTHTNWYPTSGRVDRSFENVITPASDTLDAKYLEALKPWDIHELVAYDTAYLQGVRSERYSIDLENGFENAKKVMERPINKRICRDIGGDRQSVDFVDTQYMNVKFKQILLPVWVTAYRYKDETYRIMINARTGEVQGNAPVSVIKLRTLMITILVVILYFISGHWANFI